MCIAHELRTQYHNIIYQVKKNKEKNTKCILLRENLNVQVVLSALKSKHSDWHLHSGQNSPNWMDQQFFEQYCYSHSNWSVFQFKQQQTGSNCARLVLLTEGTFLSSYRDNHITYPQNSNCLHVRISLWTHVYIDSRRRRAHGHI